MNTKDFKRVGLGTLPEAYKEDRGCHFEADFGSSSVSQNATLEIWDGPPSYYITILYLSFPL